MNRSPTTHKRLHLVSVMLVSVCTLASRLLGFLRELLFVRSLGARAISDAFLTAFRIPNTLYEIFAGGACGPAILPILAHTKRSEGIQAANQLITTLLGTILVGMSMICLILVQFSPNIVHILVPGFSHEQSILTILLLRIFLIFMWLNTGTAILAEALRAARYFFIPAMGQILVNVSFISGLILYSWFSSPITNVAHWVVFGSLLQFCMHIAGCWYVGYRPSFPGYHTWKQVLTILRRFIPCMLTSGINEIALFIELQFASYLPVGSISLMTYASSIMRLPFGILVHPLVMVLLPELTKVQAYAPRRISFLLFEFLKIILWISGPLILLLAWFSHDIFDTLYGTTQLSAAALTTLQNLLLIKLCGLLFLSINHVYLQIFYVRHETFLPTMVSLATTIWSIGVTYATYSTYGIYGIAFSSVATTMLRTCIFMNLLNTRLKMTRYLHKFQDFLMKLVLQWALVVIPWLVAIEKARHYLDNSHLTWFTQKIGFWLWLAPACLILAGILWCTRKLFNLRFYLLG